MNFNGKKILITGGNGFIGTNLAKRLRSCRGNVEVYDLDEGNDILDYPKLQSFIKKRFDFIYHLSGFSGSPKSNSQKLKSFKINSFAALKLCELIVKFSPSAKLIISGSRLEYGMPIYLPVDEKHPTLPNSIYGLTRLIASEIVMSFVKKRNLNATIIRTSNVYGPHPKVKFQGYNVINNFIDRALQNKVLTVFGDGKQIRDYIYIDDLVEAFILCSKPKANGQIYNLGYGKGISFTRMVSLICQIAKKGKLIYQQWPKDTKEVETGDYISDISKIKKELGFEPKINFRLGIEKTINFS